MATVGAPHPVFTLLMAIELIMSPVFVLLWYAVAKDPHRPAIQKHWEYSPSIGLISQIIGDRMFPLTLQGLDGAMKELNR